MHGKVTNLKLKVHVNMKQGYYRATYSIGVATILTDPKS